MPEGVRWEPPEHPTTRHVGRLHTAGLLGLGGPAPGPAAHLGESPSGAWWGRKGAPVGRCKAWWGWEGVTGAPLGRRKDRRPALRAASLALPGADRARVPWWRGWRLMGGGDAPRGRKGGWVRKLVAWALRLEVVSERWLGLGARDGWAGRWGGDGTRWGAWGWQALIWGRPAAAAPPPAVPRSQT